MFSSFRPFHVLGVLVLATAVLVGGWTHSPGNASDQQAQPALVDGGGPIVPPPVS